MYSDSSFTIGLVQQRNVDDPDVNLKRTLERIAEAVDRGARIICLQEMFQTLYFCQEEDERHFRLAESMDGAMVESLEEAAKRHGIVLVAPFFERRAPGLFHNTAVVFDADGNRSGIYRKMHIPDDPQFMEKYYFAPGEQGFATWDTRFGRIGVGICWDQWYPEAARLFALGGAEVIFYPTAIGWIQEDPDPVREAQIDAWETMQRSHAIANGCFVAAANRVGRETSPEGNEIEFWGNSFVANPAGEVIARASRSDDEVLVATIERGAIEAQRVAWPFLRDRRIDAYGDLTKRFLDGRI